MKIHELFEHPLPGTPVVTHDGFGIMESVITDPSTDNRTAKAYRVNVNGEKRYYGAGTIAPVRGMTVDILRGDGDFTNHGVTNPRDNRRSVLIVGPGIDPITAAGPDEPVLKIVKRTIAGEPYYHAEPLFRPDAGLNGWMAGGNFVYSCDSRFRNATAGYPISVHDRAERPMR